MNDASGLGRLTAQWIRDRREAARARNHRLTLWMRGTPEWTAAGARWVVAALPGLSRVCLAERPILTEPSQPLGSAAHLLGSELELLLLDLHGGFDPDGFGAATGAIRGGGLLVLLTPPPDEWARRPDPGSARIAVWPFEPETLSRRFIARLIAVLESDPDVVRIDQDERSVVTAPMPAPDPRGGRDWPSPFDDQIRPATADQAEAVAAILETARGWARRPLVLTAHRGRGKSAALGLAAGSLLLEGGRHLVVTAPRREAVATLYRHAEAVLRAVGLRLDLRRDASLGRGSLRFHSPANLVAHPPQADLVLVDEAAGIPTPLLAALLNHYTHIVFASTVHGYEGTGRGFEIRFRAILDRLIPGWRAIHLATPIRWAADDPLESLVFRALLLDAAPAASAAVLGATNEPHAQWLDRDALLQDETTLRELFGLLVLAHYQTRPLDLWMLLDGPNVRLLALRRAGHLIGALLVAAEGGMCDPKLRTAIFYGRRRPRGHLLPQTLSAHGGLLDAPLYRYWRVIRIVVHPAMRRRGLGRRLLTELQQTARAEQIDLLGASFGASVELLEFWSACGFTPAQIGTSRNAASGEHAVVVLKAVSEAGQALLEEAQRRLADGLPVWLAGPLRELDPEIAAMLIQSISGPPPASPEPNAWDAELDAFVAGHRTLEASLPLLSHLVRRHLTAALASGRIERQEAALLVAALLQYHPLTGLARGLGVQGRGRLLERIRAVFKRLVER
ncbi:tRNA(Met) cytidine acetyltransferase TmcA [Thermochromatium tepidum]|nr:GNAT family N-acetyltransferase [Thermochromatium tepidum]